MYNYKKHDGGIDSSAYNEAIDSYLVSLASIISSHDGQLQAKTATNTDLQHYKWRQELILDVVKLQGPAIESGSDCMPKIDTLIHTLSKLGCSHPNFHDGMSAATAAFHLLKKSIDKQNGVGMWSDRVSYIKRSPDRIKAVLKHEGTYQVFIQKPDKSISFSASNGSNLYSKNAKESKQQITPDGVKRTEDGARNPLSPANLFQSKSPEAMYDDVTMRVEKTSKDSDAQSEFNLGGYRANISPREGSPFQRPGNSQIGGRY
jgi:hypothetical protein